MIIGITGTVGSGKTTCAKIFQKLGAHVIDADAIGHELLTHKPIIDAIRAEFGIHILSGKKIDRKKLSESAFASAENLAALNNIMHPRLNSEINRRIRYDKPVVIDAALFNELNLARLCDVIILVQTEKAQVLKRSKAKEKTEKILSLQKPIAHADYIIDNNGTVKDLEKQARDLWRKIT